MRPSITRIKRPRGCRKKHTRLNSKQNLAHHRLKQLYEISKQLATFENVEQGFPRLLSLAARAFPLSSAVLVEKRGEIPKTTIWPTTGLNEDQIKVAITRARKAFTYLAHSTPSQTVELERSVATESALKGEEFIRQTKKANHHKFLVLPTVLYRGPVFGVLQLEASNSLDEEDLAFVDALTNLIAVALDRYYKGIDERDLEKTEREKRYEELLRSQARITSLEDERGLREKFVSTLSHDLRTPLTAAKMSAQLILLKPSAENCGLLAGRIINDIDRVDRMITDLLDANRIRAGERLRLDVAYCDLCTIMGDTIEMLRTIHGDRFIIDTNRREAWGYWSRDGLRRVIENLVNNAVKYGSPNRPVTIVLRQTKKHAQLKIHNEGNPIPARDQADLFRQFKRTSSSQASKKKGWGLGLTLVQGVVEAHGGKISIESSFGHGTTFTVELPNDSRS